MSTRLILLILTTAVYACGARSDKPAHDLPRAPETPSEPSPSDKPRFVVQEDIPFCLAAGEQLYLDLARTDPVSAPRPLIIFIHGGSWISGSRKAFLDVLPVAVARGYVAASISYRLTGQLFPGHVEDVKCAVRWLRAHASEFGADPSRIGVVGTSAGGHLALMLATTEPGDGLEGDASNISSSAVQAVVNWFGPIDLTSLYKTVGEDNQAKFREHFNGSPDENPGPYHDDSPIHYVSADDAAILTIHGTEDDLVPVTQARSFDRAARRVGLDHELVLIEGAGHGFTGITLVQVVQRTFEYFDEKLRL